MSKNDQIKARLVRELLCMADHLDRRAGICTGSGADALRLSAQMYRDRAADFQPAWVKTPQALAMQPASAVVVE